MVEFFNVETMLRRCAAIEDELESTGANTLLSELADIKKQFKTYIVKDIEALGHEHLPAGKAGYYDEVSGYEAQVQVRKKDEWDIEKLREGLTDKQKTRYITLHVDKDAIKEGIENGDLSRAKLESVGAVHKTPYSYALHVRERKTEDAPI